MFKKLFTVLLFILLVSPAILFAQESFTGTVVSVLDGDTVDVLVEQPEGKRTVRVRLAEIDTPEKKQAFGQVAKNFTLKYAAQKNVQVVVETIDRYKRVVGTIVLPDGNSLNELLVANGMAWHYKAYSKSKVLADLEQKARINKLGLWADPSPTPPWEWRRSSKAKKAKSTTSKSETVGAIYHGNTSSGVFHKSSCKYADCKNCSAGFSERESAIAAGYRPCGSCNP